MVVEDNVNCFPALVDRRRAVRADDVVQPARGARSRRAARVLAATPLDDRTGWDEFRAEYDRTHRPMWEEYDEWVAARAAPRRSPDLDFIHQCEHLNLYLYPEVVDYTGRRPLAAHLAPARLVGARDRRRVRGARATCAAATGALIYLSLGSLGSADVDLMRRLVDVLSRTPPPLHRVEGPAARQLTSCADNMWGDHQVPQTNVLPLVDLVITHGGNNTTTECFHFGKPMIVLPLFWDQYDNAQRVDETGFGVRLATYDFDDAELHGAIDRLLGDDGPAPPRARRRRGDSFPLGNAACRRPAGSLLRCSPTRTVTVAATQMACGDDADGQRRGRRRVVRQAAADGAQIVLLQELFETPYFCRTQVADHFSLARPAEDNPVIARFAALAAELGVVLPISFFERAGNAHFNSIAIVDADGTRARRVPQVAHPRRAGLPGEVLLLARRHRPDGVEHPLRPDRRGDLLGPVVPRAGAGDVPARRRVAVLPDGDRLRAARSVLDSSRHWQRTMLGHAAANITPLVASNRIGRKGADDDRRRSRSTARSFIADHTGARRRRGRPHDVGRDHRHLRSRPDRRVPRPWGLSATAVLICTARLATLDGR